MSEKYIDTFVTSELRPTVNAEGKVNSKASLKFPVTDEVRDKSFTITQMVLPGQLIPITIWPQDAYVSLLYTDSEPYTTKCEFVPFSNAPNQTVPYIYSMSQIVSSINTALGSSFTDLESKHPGTLPFQPELFFQESSGLFGVLIPIEMASTTLSPFPSVKLCLNATLRSLLFGNFNLYQNRDFTFTSVSGITNDYFNYIYTKGGLNSLCSGSLDALSFPGTGDSMLIFQNFQSYQSLYTISSIRLYMDNVGSRFTNVLSLSINDSVTNDSVPVGSRSVVLDLYTQYSSYSDKGKMYYDPSIEKYFPFQKSGPFNFISFEVTLINSDGREFPLYVPYGYMAMIQLKIRK